MSKAPVSASTSNQSAKTVHGVDHSVEIGHGNSPAAWTCVFIMLAGGLISSIAFVIASTPIFVAGIVVMFVGLIVGYIMRKAGYGVNGSKLKNSGH